MKKFYLLVLLASSVSFSQATIVYTDLNPDFTSKLDPVIQTESNLLPIDFDGDGTEEYNFSWSDLTSSSNGWEVFINPNGGNEQILNGSITSPSGSRYLNSIISGSSIHASANWGSSIPPPLIGDNNLPNFQGSGDQYIGVRFTLGSTIHYGWILVSFDINKVLTIKGYAYEDDGNTSISAGSKSSPPVLVTSISVKGEAGASTITTKGGKLQMEATVLPANATNKSVIWTVISGSGSASISTGGLLTAVSDGTVTVRATATDLSGVIGSKGISISNQTVMVSTITVQGQGGSTNISTNEGSLQMEASILPVDAAEQAITWTVTNSSGEAAINTTGLLTAIDNGLVTVTATANDGSGVTGSIDITISNQTVGVYQIVNQPFDIEVYPNPTGNVLQIKGSENGMINLYNSLGKKVYFGMKKNEPHTIDVSNYPAGVYLIKIEANHAIKTVRIVVK